MINIETYDRVLVANTKDGEIYEMQYFDKEGKQIYPKDGELCNIKGHIGKYSEEKKTFIFD